MVVGGREGAEVSYRVRDGKGSGEMVVGKEGVIREAHRGSHGGSDSGGRCREL